MKTATFVRNIESPVGEKKLFRCDPPMKDFDGNKHEFVVVSAVNHRFAHETYFFPSNKSGEMTSWLEMPGSQQGICDHKKALQYAGYTVTYGEQFPVYLLPN